jgi:arylsulfatase A-like enzyme
MTRLAELGLADKTLIAFSSDNGPEDIHPVLFTNHSH